LFYSSIIAPLGHSYSLLSTNLAYPRQISYNYQFRLTLMHHVHIINYADVFNFHIFFITCCMHADLDLPRTLVTFFNVVHELVEELGIDEVN